MDRGVERGGDRGLGCGGGEWVWWGGVGVVGGSGCGWVACFLRGCLCVVGGSRCGAGE